MVELFSAILTTTFVISVGRIKYVRFDEDRSYYPTVLIVIALVYVLFAVMSSQTDAILVEMAIACIFIAGALYGSVNSLKVVAVLLIFHGVYDFVHPHVFSYNTVPTWWPVYCLYVDVILAFWILIRYSKKNLKRI